MHRSRGRPRQDLPRLVDGHVALQVFTAFTHVPSAPRCAGPLPVCDPLPVGNSNASFDAVAALVPFSGAKRRAQSANAKRTPLTRAPCEQATRCARCAACASARCTRRGACATWQRAAAARLYC